MSDSSAAIAAGSAQTQIRRLVLTTQAVFFAALAWCYAVEHGPQTSIDGISYYGVHLRTLPVLLVGYLVAAFGLWRTAEYLRSAAVSPVVWWGLRIVALSLVALLFTPYDRGPVLNWSHMGIGVAGALCQLAISLRLLEVRRTARSVAGFAVQLTGGLVAAASLPNWHFPYLLLGEIVYQVGFGWCLIEWTYAVSDLDSPRRSQIDR